MKKITTILLLISMLSLSSCMVFSNGDIHSNTYDDDKKIINDTNSFSISNDEQVFNDEEIICTADFSGKDEIWSYNAENDESVEISFSLSVSKGKAKLVFVDGEGALKTIMEVDKESKAEDSTEVLNVKEGNNSIKIVALKAKGLSFDINSSKGSFNELGELEL